MMTINSQTTKRWVAVVVLAMGFFTGKSTAGAITNDHHLSFMMGPLTGYGTRASTYSWSFSYMEGLSEHWAWSITKINEGHDDDHHRDGSSVQLWVRTFVPQHRLMLGAGIGPHFYCDTVTSTEYEQGYENRHGAGVAISALARWQFHHPWSLELRGNAVQSDDGVHTAALLFGLGHTLEPSWTTSRPANVRLNEVTVMGGANIVNSFGSETGGAIGLEYRRYVLPWLNATVAALHEGKTDSVNRRGLAPQIWLGRHFDQGHLSAGIGVGPYFSYDSHRTDQPQLATEYSASMLLSYTAAYHFDSGFLARITWHRVATFGEYNRDTDIILLGAGYGF